MPGDKFPTKPIKVEQHESDINWTLNQLKIHIPDLNQETSTDIIVTKLKMFIEGKPDNFYSELESRIRENLE